MYDIEKGAFNAPFILYAGNAGLFYIAYLA
jgi:hypothetical protein